MERKVGRTVLRVDTRERSTLQGGRSRAKSGRETVYVVLALANASRGTITLGTFATLAQAEAFKGAYSPRYGLIGHDPGWI